MAIFQLKVTLVMAALVIPMAACSALGFHSWDWHQKLTLVVSTPSGTIEASSVSRVRIDLPARWWGVGDTTGASQQRLYGEAVVLEVTKGKYLFGLLKNYGLGTAQSALIGEDVRIGTRDDVIDVYDKIIASRKSVPLPPSLYPMLVTYRDNSDPSTIAVVNPGKLEEFFGPGISLQGIQFSITDDDTRYGQVAKVLPWMVHTEWVLPRNMRQPALKYQTPIQTISKGDFGTEGSWKSE
jgi:hypothetical protein